MGEFRTAYLIIPATPLGCQRTKRLLRRGPNGATTAGRRALRQPAWASPLQRRLQLLQRLIDLVLEGAVHEQGVQDNAQQAQGWLIPDGPPEQGALASGSKGEAALHVWAAGEAASEGL